ELAGEIARSEGLSLSLTRVGSRLTTVQCLLTNQSGVQSRGLGKGIGDQSTASAVFEAFEHYLSLSLPLANERPSMLRLELDGRDTHLRDASPDLSRIAVNDDVWLGRLTYRS